MNTVERLRREMGMSRPKMLELVGARLDLLSAPDDEIDPAIASRAVALRGYYDEWLEDMIVRLEGFERKGIDALTCSEVQELFDLRDFHVTQFRYRGMVRTEYRRNEYYFPLSELRRLIRENGLSLEQGKRKVRGPITMGFLRWLGKRVGGGLDYSVPGRSGVLPVAEQREAVAV